MSSREDPLNQEKVWLQSGPATESYEAGYDEEEYEYIIQTDHTMVQEHVEHVFFRIKEYLHENQERELLQNLTMKDVALMLYDEIYLQQITTSVSSPFI
jgi:hypothetical protein